MGFSVPNPHCFEFSSTGEKQIRNSGAHPLLGFGFWKYKSSSSRGAPGSILKGIQISLANRFNRQSWQPLTDSKAVEKTVGPSVKKALANRTNGQSRQPLTDSKSFEKKMVKKVGKNQHHLWSRRDSAGSGQKALNLVRIVSGLPNEKEAVYGALDKWTAWETEFPLIAAAKALQILKERNQWLRVIQVAKWMLSKGQGATMATYDTLLLAFDMDQRVDEAESLWNMILHTHTRSTSKRLFSRMVSLYDHHDMPDKIIEVFADIEELGVKPDEDTIRRVACAFRELGQVDKQTMVLKKYQSKWKYIHYKGERVRVRRDPWAD